MYFIEALPKYDVGHVIARKGWPKGIGFGQELPRMAKELWNSGSENMVGKEVLTQADIDANDWYVVETFNIDVR